MFPKLECDTSLACLESLVALRSSCKTGDCAPMYVESSGMTIKKISKLATESQMNADEFIKDIIHFSAQEMLGDIQSAINGGYSLKDVVADFCSACDLTALYVAGTGVIIRNKFAAQFGYMNIQSLNLLCNANGSQTVVIDDGTTLTTFAVTTVAGTIMPVTLNYVTQKAKIKIYLQDNAVGMGKIVCASPSGCGCGKKIANNPLVITGLVGGIESTDQYGFLVCASVTCSTDAMICRLVAALPNKIALILFYKVAGKLYRTAALSERNNDAAGFDAEGKQSEEQRYDMLYWANVKGSLAVKGLKGTISDFLAQNVDGCVTCKTNRSIAYATG